jgi:hypothetical protein
MGRERIEMTPVEVHTFLGAQRWVVLATLDDDGTPVGDLVPATLREDRLCFVVPAGSRPHDNIERDPRVACAADEFPSYYEIRGAVVHGRAVRAGESRLGAEWVEYDLPLDDVASFDFRKIRGKE